MSLVAWIIAVLILIVWGFTLVDIFKRPFTTGQTVAWIALIIILPFIGSVIYWAVRKPTEADVEQARLAEADLRHSRADKPIGPTGRM